MNPAKKAYTVREAAEIASVSVGTIRHAIKSVDDNAMPHLRAKMLGGRAGYRIKDADLDDWIDRWQDA